MAESYDHMMGSAVDADTHPDNSHAYLELGNQMREMSTPQMTSDGKKYRATDAYKVKQQNLQADSDYIYGKVGF